MLLSEVLVEAKGDMDKNLADVYPQLKLPITRDQLKKVYKDFNKLYFGNELPKNLSIEIKQSGTAWGVTHYEYATKDISITISPKIVKAVKSCIDVLVHEMIHVWSFDKYNKTDDNRYLDEKLSKTLKMAGMIEGHGIHFIKHMHRLNRLGFEINLKADVQTMVEVDASYVFIGLLQSGFTAIVYSPNDIRKTLDVTIDSVLSSVGRGLLHSYSIIKTDNSGILHLPKLTKAGKIQATTRDIEYQPEVAKKFIKGSVIIVKNVQIDLSGGDISDVDTDIMETIRRVNKNFRGKSFVDYISATMVNTGAYRQIANSLSPNYQYPTEIKGVSKPTLKYMYDAWKDVALSEIRGDNEFKGLVLHGQAVLGNITDGRYVELQAIDVYDKNLKGRISEKEFYKMLFDRMIVNIMAHLKKRPYALKSWIPDWPTDDITKKDMILVLKAKFKGSKLG